MRPIHRIIGRNIKMQYIYWISVHLFQLFESQTNMEHLSNITNIHDLIGIYTDPAPNRDYTSFLSTSRMFFKTKPKN